MWRTTILAAATALALAQAATAAHASNFDRGGFRGSESGLTELGRDRSGELFGVDAPPSRGADDCRDGSFGDGLPAPCG